MGLHRHSKASPGTCLHGLGESHPIQRYTTKAAKLSVARTSLAGVFKEIDASKGTGGVYKHLPPTHLPPANGRQGIHAGGRKE